jgi:hypothetical protein
MILGVNDGAGDGQFPWIPLLFFILLGLSCTDMVCERWVVRVITRLCQIMTRYEVGRFSDSILSGFCRNNSNNSMQVLESPLFFVDNVQTLEVLSDGFSSVRREFEELLSINSIDAKVKEAISEVFVKLDEINSLRESPGKSFIQLVRQILKKVGESHNIIQPLLDDHRDDLSPDDRSRISELINHIGLNIKWAENLLGKHETLTKTLERLLNQKIDKRIRNKDWEVIVIDMSTIAQHLDAFPCVYSSKSLEPILNGTEFLVKHVISSTMACMQSDVSQSIDFEHKAKLAPRHYPRFASLIARQLLSDIQIKRAVWFKGQSAEAKAIERIEDENLSEWEIVPQIAEPIKIEEIRSRLKERGYGKSV